MDLSQTLQIVSRTDPGIVRAHNEDAVASDAVHGLVVLADGMGGYNAGEVASGMATAVITTEMARALESVRPQEFDPQSRGPNAERLIREQILKANTSIYQAAQSQPQYAGMGTTLVTCLFYDNRISIAHVGDSRLYRFRRGRFEQLTMDHSLLQELVDRGFYSQEEAARSTNRNYVTRALGVEPTVQVEVQEAEVQPGDVYLLCSDGLPDMVEDEDIHLTISTFNANLQMAGQQLIQLSNDHGGKDNVSVILAQVVEPFPARTGVLQKLRRIFQ